MYWRLRCAEALGHGVTAEKMRASLQAEHPLSFQNLAANARDEQFLDRLSAAPTPQFAMRSTLRPEANSLVRAIEALIATGAMDLAGESVDLLSGEIAALEPEVQLHIASLMNRAGQGLAKFRLMAQIFQERPQWVGPVALRLYFPLWYYSALEARTGEIDPFLIISLVRQESAFNAKARSGVGARGLMQVMPSTVRARSAGAKKRLFEPLFNLEAGTKVFHRSLDRFSGDVELTLAAYNAGPERVARWTRRYAVNDRILFIDLLPYKETRDYVTSILRNYYWYVELYGDRDQVAARLPASIGDAAARSRLNRRLVRPRSRQYRTARERSLAGHASARKAPVKHAALDAPLGGATSASEPVKR